MGQPGRPQGRSSLAREKRTRGTETSQYPEEEKATAIPLVAASERGPAQTRGACTPWVVGSSPGRTTSNRSGPEWPAQFGDSPGGLRYRPLTAYRQTADKHKAPGRRGDDTPRV